MNKSRAEVAVVSVLAGLGGASHGPGEILQGNVAPGTLMIEAWPDFTAMGGMPAMTIVPNFIVTGVLAIVFGVLIALWAVVFVERKVGGLVLVLLSTVMLLVGGGIVPPFFGIAAGLIGVFISRNSAKQGAAKLSLLF